MAHDIGNPPFGHSGEKAISQFFLDNGEKKNIKTRWTADKHILTSIKDIYINDSFPDKERWGELTHFEGNANGLRYLTHSYDGKIKGGLRLTYTTLASTLKYPCSYNGINGKYHHRKKYNFFLSETEIFKEICGHTKMIIDNNDISSGLLAYKRHPFVYLTEAADDICYKLIDIEDAQRLGIVNSDRVIESFLSLIKFLRVHGDYNRVEIMSNSIRDVNDRVSYLRAKCINALAVKCAEIFMENSDEILNGTFNTELLKVVVEKVNCEVLQTPGTRNNGKCMTLEEMTENIIYKHPKVVKIEALGYKILNDLLDIFIPAMVTNCPSKKDEKFRQIIPLQFQYENMFEIVNNEYDRVFSVLDFFSGMTDEFALRLYRELTGVQISSHD